MTILLASLFFPFASNRIVMDTILTQLHLPISSMLEISDYPNLARVIRVQPLPNEKPATGFSWADYEDVGEHDADGEDDGWDVVTNKRSSMFI